MAPVAAPICTASPYISTRMYCSRLSLRSGGATVFCLMTACQKTWSVSSIGTCTESLVRPDVIASSTCFAFFRSSRRERERMSRMLRTGLG